MSVVRSSSTVSLPPPFLLPPLFHHPYPPHHPPPPVTLISTTGQRFNGADSDRQPRRSNAHHTTPPPTSTYWTRLRTAKKIAVPDRPAAAQRPKGVNGGGGGRGCSINTTPVCSPAPRRRACGLGRLCTGRGDQRPGRVPQTKCELGEAGVKSVHVAGVALPPPARAGDARPVQRAPTPRGVAPPPGARFWRRRRPEATRRRHRFAHRPPLAEHPLLQAVPGVARTCLEVRRPQPLPPLGGQEKPPPRERPPPHPHLSGRLARGSPGGRRRDRRGRRPTRHPPIDEGGDG